MVSTGLSGVVAQALFGKDYSSGNASQALGGDIAAGTLAQAPDRREADRLAVLAVMLGLT